MSGVTRVARRGGEGDLLTSEECFGATNQVCGSIAVASPTDCRRAAAVVIHLRRPSLLQFVLGSQKYFGWCSRGLHHSNPIPTLRLVPNRVVKTAIATSPAFLPHFMSPEVGWEIGLLGWDHFPRLGWGSSHQVTRLGAYLYLFLLQMHRRHARLPCLKCNVRRTVVVGKRFWLNRHRVRCGEACG